MQYSKRYETDLQQMLGHIVGRKCLYGKTILITGGTGMICSAIAELLMTMNRMEHAGIRVILAGRSRARMEQRFAGFEPEKEFSFFAYDATEKMAETVAADYIIHGASNANPAIYTRQPVETMLANLMGLNELLRMAAATGTKRLLYISSSEVYGQKDELRPYEENDYGFVDILNQRASYPSAKRAAETLCVAYSREYDLDTVIVRPGHIYGPTITDSDSRASAQFTRNAVNGENIVMKSAGTQLRSYCHTHDCATAILTVLCCGEREQAYNISNRDSVVTISQMASALAAAAGTKVVYEDPTALEQQGYNLMSNSSLNAEKLEGLGWTAVYGLEEGTRETYEVLKGL